MTLGYGRKRADPDPLIRAVNDVWVAPLDFAVDTVHLVAVDQDSTQGIYTWKEPLATIELGFKD